MLWSAAWNVSSCYFLLILPQGIRTLCVEKLGVSGVKGWSELDDSLHPCWRLQSQWTRVRLHNKPAASSGAVTWHQICDGGSCIFFLWLRSTATWPLDPSKEEKQGWRHVRIKQMGKNASGQTHYLSLSGLELYGTVTAVCEDQLGTAAVLLIGLSSSRV